MHTSTKLFTILLTAALGSSVFAQAPGGVSSGSPDASATTGDSRSGTLGTQPSIWNDQPMDDRTSPGFTNDANRAERDDVDNLRGTEWDRREFEDERDFAEHPLDDENMNDDPNSVDPALEGNRSDIYSE